ncbi:hypothetical protein LUX05_24595 [Streptomyces somaliensis]|nr:hypothetical protein [Streptomyces somaliensis]
MSPALAHADAYFGVQICAIVYIPPLTTVSRTVPAVTGTGVKRTAGTRVPWPRGRPRGDGVHRVAAAGATAISAAAAAIGEAACTPSCTARRR